MTHWIQTSGVELIPTAASAPEGQVTEAEGLRVRHEAVVKNHLQET